MKKNLQKFIADSGFCSRRKAEELIKKGKVFLNGKVAEPGSKASEKDDVRIGKRTIREKKEKIYIKLNKPKGYTCTNRKFGKEKNIFELLNIKERMFVLGRLDKDSRGLVVLTNDGDWAYKMTHPSFEHEKEYYVKIKNQNTKIKENLEKKLTKGVDIGEGDGTVKAKEVKQISDNIFKIILTQGRKRQIRRMFKPLGYKVEDLKRTRINDIELGDLEESNWNFLKKP